MDETYVPGIGRQSSAAFVTQALLVTPGPHLCPGCSDPYTSGLNGDQNSIGSRAWVNPFTGSFPSTANNHSGHSHNGVSHRILVEMSDLNPAQNPGATYFGEAAYITPHEYTWCQSHPRQCNMFNNYSYRRFSVTGGPTIFNFPPVGSTVRMQPAIQAWAVTRQSIRLNPIRVTMAFGLWATK